MLYSAHCSRSNCPTVQCTSHKLFLLPPYMSSRKKLERTAINRSEFGNEVARVSGRVEDIGLQNII
jgi:hypothetical protein